MSSSRNARLGIPLERTVPHRRPGRWMPFVWVLFAGLLTMGIVTAIRILVPDVELRPAVVQKQARPAPTPGQQVPMIAALVEAGSLDLARPDGIREPAEPLPAPVAPVPVPVEVAEPAPSMGPEVPGAAGFAPPSAVEEPASVPADLSGVESQVEDEAPAAVLTEPAALEWRRDGRVAGVLYLKAGDPVHVVSHEGGNLVRVRWKNAEGFVGERAIRFNGQ